MRRAIVATAGVVSALLVLLLALAAFVPVTFVATTGVSEQSVADGLWERNDRPTPSTVRIVADDGPARVLITLAPPEVTYDQNDMIRYEQELTEAAAMPLPDEGDDGDL